ncbi:unnamed protein product [Paramecium sonneborni]|uniref:Uncharacterized protein n=1 Tax=Paramecium sonneborni TaxID=65129 RepID=A0A8S1QY09_9CILI|nr:unnamed protein product [Paramecium sonneborni]
MLPYVVVKRLSMLQSRDVTQKDMAMQQSFQNQPNEYLSGGLKNVNQKYLIYILQEYSKLRFLICLLLLKLVIVQICIQPKKIKKFRLGNNKQHKNYER